MMTTHLTVEISEICDDWDYAIIGTPQHHGTL